MIRRRIVFSGCVQGVGFRWRARQAAALYGCTGFCRNEWDGTVTLEIQGEQEQIDKVIEALQRGRYVEIEGMEITPLSLREERDFYTE